MKTYSIILLTLVFYLHANCQTITSLKTDKDCLKFLREKLDNPIFEFDTSFDRPYFLNQLAKTQHKYWGIADINQDGKPDLYFVGQTKAHGSYAYASEASVYISCKSGKYEFLDLITADNSSGFTPKIIHKKKLGKDILCVYLCGDYGILDRDSLIIKDNKYPDYVKWVDSLIFMNNKLVNYYSKPSKIQFDTLEYSFQSGWSNSDFKLKILKNGSCYVESNSGELSEISIGKDNFKLLQELIYSLDIKSIRANFLVGWTDQNSAKLKIYENGKVYVLEDYGMQSNFTLTTIYKLFFELIKNSN